MQEDSFAGAAAAAENVEKPACCVVRPGETYGGKQGFDYFAGISRESVGARGLCMHLLEIPPGGRARAHLHERHESAIYVLSGEGEMWFGPELAEHVVVRAGEFLFIPAGTPHLPANRSAAAPCVAVVARTDPNEQESVVLLPHLDAKVPSAAGADDGVLDAREA
jgi:uncharacterized RmlC-like cupin family protein